MSADLVPASSDTALTSDPVQYMAVVLNRAKSWLSEAQSIAEVRETRALAVGYESVIREKELAFDAQLSATEIVRRCERRIGELVREGQRSGEVRVRGQSKLTNLRDPMLVGGFTNDGERNESYVLADAPAVEFEQAVVAAREEGNLSRANVVRKVKGEEPKAERSKWHHNRRRIDSNRILTSLANDLEAATAGLDLIDPDELDPDLLDTSVRTCKRAIAEINRHLRRVQDARQ